MPRPVPINVNAKSWQTADSILKSDLKMQSWGTWVAQSVKPLTSAQVMISQLVSSSPMLGFVLTAQSLEPASDSVSQSLSSPHPLALACSLSQK